MAILKNIDIEILEHIDIDKISNIEQGFGIWNTPAQLPLKSVFCVLFGSDGQLKQFFFYRRESL